jgi:hypothetical protein
MDRPKNKTSEIRRVIADILMNKLLLIVLFDKIYLLIFWLLIYVPAYINEKIWQFVEFQKKYLLKPTKH